MRKKKEIAAIGLTIAERNTEARIWLNHHDLFNIAALCKRIDYDRGSFSRFMEGHIDLSDVVINKLEISLRPYGYL